MKWSSRARHSAVATLAGLVLLAMWPGVRATAASDEFRASADASLFHAEEVAIPDNEATDVTVAPAFAEADSGGLSDGGNAYGRAANLDVEAPNNSDDPTVFAEAEHRAPSDVQGPVSETLGEVPADPLMNAQFYHASAHSRWAAGGCVPVGTPLSISRSEMANVGVITDTEAGDALVAFENSQGGTVYSESKTELVDVSGQAGKGVAATATSQMNAFTLFQGTEDQLTVNIVAPPVVRAVATGKPGTASVTYSEPILQVLDAQDEILGELNVAEHKTELDLSPVSILRLGHLDSHVSSDGTQASATASLLDIEVPDSEGSEPVSRFTVAGGQVSAQVPVGGVTCAASTPGTTPTPGPGDDGDDGGDEGENPIDAIDDCGTANPLTDLEITSSQPVVAPDSTFVYIFVVKNNGPCPITEVKVVETIDGPDGSSITDTNPDADDIDNMTVTWNDVGPLDPGESKDLEVTVKVPAGAADGSSYRAEAAVTAVMDGDEFAGSAAIDEPTVESEVKVGGLSLPRTGVDIAKLIALGLGLVVVGEGLRRRSRRRTA